MSRFAIMPIGLYSRLLRYLLSPKPWCFIVILVRLLYSVSASLPQCPPFCRWGRPRRTLVIPRTHNRRHCRCSPCTVY
ncbi:hypothetical protein BGZ63DRAFT_372373 [Mariannaea sp. PMI_226]|nr:hypothetical protein BGZ63DRAFT_372373 [Mariannaea sp. PMI_226]